MRRLDQGEYLSTAKPALLKLFIDENPDPFSNPFLPEVGSKIIVAGGVPKDGFLAAIKEAASVFGDSGFYLHNPNPSIDKLTSKQDWYISFDELGKFKSEALVDHFEYIYFSPNGHWGLATSDVHGVLGSSNDFCKAIASAIPDILHDRLHFINYWLKIKDEFPEKVDIEWLEPMLINLYGYTEYVQLINAAKNI